MSPKFLLTEIFVFHLFFMDACFVYVSSRKSALKGNKILKKENTKTTALARKPPLGDQHKEKQESNVKL